MINKRPQGIIAVNEVIKNIVVDLAYATNNNFTGQIVPYYQQNIAFLTTRATAQLLKVQEEANQFGLGLKIFDSYRPASSVKFFYQTWREQEENLAIKKRFYPELSKEDLFKLGYVATRSTHSRASTIDLTLIDQRTAQELDMGTEFDFFSEASHTAYPHIDPMAQKNRLLLKSLMEKNGFINFKNEWWHFRLENEPYPETYFDFPIKI